MGYFSRTINRNHSTGEAGNKDGNLGGSKTFFFFFFKRFNDEDVVFFDLLSLYDKKVLPNRISDLFFNNLHSL